MLLNIFFILAEAAILFDGADWFVQLWQRHYRETLSENIQNLDPVVQEEMLFKGFSEKSLFLTLVAILLGGTEPFMQFIEGIMSNIHILFLKLKPVVQEMTFKELLSILSSGGLSFWWSRTIYAM